MYLLLPTRYLEVAVVKVTADIAGQISLRGIGQTAYLGAKHLSARLFLTRSFLMRGGGEFLEDGFLRV